MFINTTKSVFSRMQVELGQRKDIIAYADDADSAQAAAMSIRDEIEANGGIKLIYIDPPFDVGADFSTFIEIGDSNFEKAPTVLEEIAFRDTWGKGEDSFLVAEIL